jgi:cephalosporin hydroxylase
MGLIERSVDYYNTAFKDMPTWRGRPCLQFRSDMIRYAELIHEFNPPFVVEIGTNTGGTALFLADVMSSFGNGKVITIDITDPGFSSVRVKGLHFLHGSSTDPDIVDSVKEIAAGQHGIVLIDGDHHADQVREELDLYADMANYIVVQDTIMRYRDMPDNPADALDEWWMAHGHDWWAEDAGIDMTQQPGGWLRRKVPA